jgi:hypothetical protein
VEDIVDYGVNGYVFFRDQLNSYAPITLLTAAEVMRPQKAV